LDEFLLENFFLIRKKGIRAKKGKIGQNKKKKRRKTVCVWESLREASPQGKWNCL